MATNIVSGLFGIDPDALQQQQQASASQRAFNYANLSAPEQAQYGAYMGGTMAAQAAQGLMGMQDPTMQKATMAKQLATQFDITTADGLRQYAKALAQNGAPDLAQMAAAEADKRQSNQLDIKQSTLNVQASEAKAAQEAKLQEELSKLGPNPTDEQLLGVYRRYGNPDKQALAMSRSMDIKDKAAAKQELADQGKKELAQTTLDSAVEGKTLVESLDKQVGYNTVGLGSALSWVPMTEAKKFNADLSTLKSKLTLAAMNAAKSQSRTGATGFGALNSKELKVLQDNIAALDTGLSPEDFKSKLAEVKDYFNKLETKSTSILQPGSQSPDTGEFADDYKKYKEKYGNQAMPYNAYVQKRKG